MEFFESPVVVANSWKTELMDSIIATANLEGWTTIRNAYDDGTYIRWVLESPDEKFNAIFFTVKSALNTATDSTGNATLYATIAETYDTSTEKFNGVAPVRNNNFVADNTTETYDNSFTIATLISAGNSGPGFVPCGGLAGTGSFPARTEYYAISVDADTINLALRLISGVPTNLYQYLYIGNINSEVISASTNDPNNACIFMYGISGTMLTGGTSATGGSVRSPMNGGKAAHSWSHSMVPPFIDNGQTPDSILGYTNTSSTTWDQWQGAVGPTASEVILYRVGGETQPTFGLYRGKAKNVIYATSDAVYGDLITIGTDTYYCTQAPAGGTGSPRFWIRSA